MEIDPEPQEAEDAMDYFSYTPSKCASPNSSKDASQAIPKQISADFDSFQKLRKKHKKTKAVQEVKITVDDLIEVEAIMREEERLDSECRPTETFGIGESSVVESEVPKPAVSSAMMNLFDF